MQIRLNLLLISLAIYANALQGAEKSDTSPLSTENQIREVAFKYVFCHNPSFLQNRAGAYYLGIESEDSIADPEESLLRQFGSSQVPVRRESECVNDPEKGIRDAITGIPGLRFRANYIEWINQKEVWILIKYYEAPLRAAGQLLHVKKFRTGWKVVKCILAWIA